MPRLTLPLAVLAISAAMPGVASAHAFLKTATPPVGSTLRAAPTQVVIDYTEGVEPKFSLIEVQDASGACVDTGSVQTAPTDNKQLMVELKALTPGSYKVTWHVTAVDTHKTEGSYSFTLKP